MIAGLERFVTELRGAGVSASPSEWLDAMRAIELLGVADRERFRVALRASLAKRAGQRDVFDAIFDRFFASPARGAGGGERSRSGARGARGPRSAPEPPTVRGRGIRAGEEHERIDRGALLRRLEQAREGGPERRGRLLHVVVERRSDAKARTDTPRRTDATDPLRAELKRSLTLEQEREIALLVPRLVEQIRLRTARRQRRASRGRPYMRRLFRDSLSHGGVPFVLPRRRPRPRRSRVVLFIDVSWSTARAAGLFLSLAAEFLRRARETRVLLFVDRTADATSAVQAWLARGRHDEATFPARPSATPRGTRRRVADGIVRAGVSFGELLASLPGLNLDAPSDYGRAFHHLLHSPLGPAGRDTVLLVLGDGRTNRFDPQDWSFEAIVDRCGAVLWLVPESIDQWGTGDSALPAYLGHVDTAIEARDIRGLARGVAELARRLGS